MYLALMSYLVSNFYITLFLLTKCQKKPNMSNNKQYIAETISLLRDIFGVHLALPSISDAITGLCELFLTKISEKSKL